MNGYPIPVPDILPNNIRAIRLMRRKNLKEVADDLMINPNFLGTVETQKNNLSGKSTIRFMKYFNVNFYQLYDIESKIVLPYTDESVKKNINVDVILNAKALSSEPEVIEDEILKELLKNNISNQIYSYKILKKQKTSKPNYYLCTIEVELIEQIQKEMEFDINFFRDTDVELAKVLSNRGFKEQIETIQKDSNEIIIKKDRIILDKPYKILSFNNKFIEKAELNLNNDKIKLLKDEKGDIVSIEFMALEPEINCLKFIEKYKNLDPKKIHTALNLTYNGYTNLVNGNQKISTKVMWRMVKLFKVPLELMINIDKYNDKFCKKNDFITKK